MRWRLSGHTFCFGRTLAPFSPVREANSCRRLKKTEIIVIFLADADSLETKCILLMCVVIWSLIMTCRIAEAREGDIFVVISGRRVSNVVVVAKSGGQFKTVREMLFVLRQTSRY
jgi:hypothetical protein